MKNIIVPYKANLTWVAKPDIFKKAKTLRSSMTEVEEILWKRLRDRQLSGLKFRRQHPIDIYIADFYCHQEKLIVELDGEIHEIPEQKEYDDGRTFHPVLSIFIQIFSVMKKYKWGILVPGKMSAKFTRALKLLRNVELYSVGSRDPERAKEFAREFGFKKSFGSYEELVADPELEIVYIASPHSHHLEHTLLCLKNRKAVMCEKAFALNSHEVSEMVAEATRQKVFLMEALWPPFQPVYKKTKEIILSGLPGKILHMNARFAFQAPYDPLDRKFNVALGGSSLLDIGIYSVIDALYFMGVPSEITAKASFAESGSEDSISIIFGYEDGRSAIIYSSFRTAGGIGCDLLCENGNLYFSRERDMSQQLRVDLKGKSSKKYSLLPKGMGYQFEASEVMHCLDAGKLQSEIVPLSFSLDLINTLDRIRKSAGIVFPGRD